jgi:hypothetical protein
VRPAVPTAARMIPVELPTGWVQDIRTARRRPKPRPTTSPYSGARAQQGPQATSSAEHSVAGLAAWPQVTPQPALPVQAT